MTTWSVNEHPLTTINATVHMLKNENPTLRLLLQLDVCFRKLYFFFAEPRPGLKSVIRHPTSHTTPIISSMAGLLHILHPLRILCIKAGIQKLLTLNLMILILQEEISV